MKRLVIISPGFPMNEQDSACLPFLQIYLKELIKSTSWSVTVITEQYPASLDYSWNGIPVITLHKKEPLILHKLFRYVRLKRALKQLHKQQSIAAIHNFWFTRSALLAGKFAEVHRIPHVVTFAGQDVLPQNHVLRFLPFYKGQVFCVSEFQRRKLLENTGINANVVTPGIEDMRAGNQERVIDLMFCGWITPLKNYRQFLEIVHAVNKHHALRKIVMCGGGGLQELNKEIKLLGLETLIEVKGETPRDEVLQLMQKTKLLVHTSNFESFGLVLAEALASGCRVISKPVGMADRNPHVITCTTTAEFINQVQHCLAQPEPFAAPVSLYPVSEMVNSYLLAYQP